MNTAILYCRVSTREQAETGHSLEAQEELLRGYARQKGFQIAAVIAVPESASGARERVHFAQMLSRVNTEKIDHILVEKVDRISRNFKEAIKLQDWLDIDAARHIHFVKQSLVIGQNSKSSDTFMWDIFLSMARQYSRNLSEEVKKGQRIAVAKGMYVGAPKVGYLCPCTHGRSTQSRARTPNPAMAPVIKEIFQRLHAGESSSVVWAWLQKDGRLQSSRGKQLTRARFYTFIRDPFVCGQFLFNGMLYEGRHEPIVSKQHFYAVQDILDGRRNRKTQSHEYIYQGIARTPDGALMRCTTNKGYAYYNRNGFYLPEAKLDATVAEWFKSFKISDEGIEHLKTACMEYLRSFFDSRREERDAAMKQINLLEARIDVATKKVLDGVLDDDTYRRTKAMLQAEREVILRVLPDKQELKDNMFEPMEFIFKTLKNLNKTYPELSKEAKREISRIFLFELICERGKITIQAKPEVQALLEPLKLQSGGASDNQL